MELTKDQLDVFAIEILVLNGEVLFRAKHGSMFLTKSARLGKTSLRHNQSALSFLSHVTDPQSVIRHLNSIFV